MGHFITQTSLFDIHVIWVNTGLHFVCENKVELVLPTKRIFTKSFHKRVLVRYQRHNGPKTPLCL
jgi:hypothetical protein